MRVAKNINNDGFTLVEIIVAIVVTTLVTTGLYTMVNNIRGLNDRSRDLVLINALIEDKIEELRNATFVALDDGDYEFTDQLPPTIAGPREAIYSISTVAGGNGLKQVMLNVSYSEAGASRTLSYVTYIGELGIGQY